MKKLLLLLLPFFAETSSAQVSESDFQALKAFYEATNGAKWVDNTGWDFSQGAEVVKSWEPEDRSGWYGVTVNSSGRVIGISLPRNNLVGYLPNEICNLQKLKWLSLSYNQLKGVIPDNIGQLTLLESLSLSNNKLQGQLPASFYEVGKDAATPEKDEDGWDTKSNFYVTLANNSIKGINAAQLVSMPLFCKDAGFEISLDKTSCKGKLPKELKKWDKRVVYSKNYIIDRVEDEPIFSPWSVDVPAKFDGSSDIGMFRLYVSERLKFPENQKNEEQVVTISFVVDKEGKIYIRKIQGDIRNNARSVVLSTAKYWKPAKLNDKPVSVGYSIPIIFKKR